MNPQQSDNYIEFPTEHIWPTLYSHIIITQVCLLQRRSPDWLPRVSLSPASPIMARITTRQLSCQSQQLPVPYITVYKPLRLTYHDTCPDQALCYTLIWEVSLRYIYTGKYTNCVPYNINEDFLLCQPCDIATSAYMYIVSGCKGIGPWMEFNRLTIWRSFSSNAYFLIYYAALWHGVNTPWCYDLWAWWVWP